MSIVPNGEKRITYCRYCGKQMPVKNNITSDREVVRLIDSACLKCKIKRLVGLGTTS